MGRLFIALTKSQFEFVYPPDISAMTRQDETRRDGIRIEDGGWSARDDMFRKILNPARASSTSLPPNRGSKTI